MVSVSMITQILKGRRPPSCLGKLTPSLIWKWYLLSETVNSISLRSRLWSSVVGSPSILVLYLSTLLSVEQLIWCLPAPSSSFCLSAVMFHSLRFFVGFSASTDLLHQFLEKTYIFFLHISPHSPQHKGNKADLSWNANRSNRAGECDVSFKNCHRKVVTFLLAMPQIEIFRYLHICEGFFLLKHIQWFCQDISFCKGIVGVRGRFYQGSCKGTIRRP